MRVTLRHDRDALHPMHRFVCDHGGYGDYRLIHWNRDADGTNALLFHVHGPREPYEARLADLRRVRSFDLAPVDDDAFYVHVHEEPSETDASLLDAFSRGGLVAVPPIEYRTDRTMTMGVVGDPAVLQATFDAVPEGIDVAVDRVSEAPSTSVPAGRDLTTRQREVVRAAKRLGYYEVPRAASVEDVADAVDCAPGTAAEHLRKAESRVFADLDV
nr:helix-turn-helix domain-containing protein [Halorubellus sp. JP-L1]